LLAALLVPARVRLMALWWQQPGRRRVVVAVSFFRVSAAGAVTISDGLVFAASGTVAGFGVELEVVNGRRRQVGRFGTRDRGVDRKLRGTAAGSPGQV